MADFQKECPGVYASLSRMLTEVDLQVISSDYARAAEHGGNHETALTREEGVSFNPRLARVLSILLLDGDVREVSYLRASLFAALHHGTEVVVSLTPEELRVAVAECRNLDSTDERALAVQAAIRLDLVRHFHMTAHSREEKLSLLATSKNVPLLHTASRVPDMLKQKLSHAILLQERRLRQEGE